MTATDKPTDRTPEPSPTVRAIRNSVLYAIRERDNARRYAEYWRALCVNAGAVGHKMPWERTDKSGIDTGGRGV